jgi:MSHA pilin protein MshD
MFYNSTMPINVTNSLDMAGATGKGRPRSAHQRGASLVELVMFIMIVGIALAGTLLVMNRTTSQSGDPMLRKQALAIAESLLEEIELKGFTYCDPDDTLMYATAGGTGNCTSGYGEDHFGAETLGGIETRPYGALSFDSVNDYHEYNMAGITDYTGTVTPIVGLEHYTAAVTVEAVNQAFSGVPNPEWLFITVLVTAPDGTSITLNGYRTRFAPNG